MRRAFLSKVSDLARHIGLWQKILRDQGLLDFVRSRTLMTCLCFTLAFVIITVRLVDVMVLRGLPERDGILSSLKSDAGRADIVDRHGAVLATHLVTASVYANPQQILNAEEAAQKLATIIPEMHYETVYERLRGAQKKFVWIARHVSPNVQQAINQAGIPGVYLLKDNRRVYPYAHLVSHVVGYTGIEGDGLAGIERYFDARLKNERSPLQLSVDVRVQHIVRDELLKAISKFSAKAGNGMMIDLETGEILAMVSIPDFDPHNPGLDPEATFNRNTLGVYEPGSVFKVYNTVIALETGFATLKSLYDASAPLRVGRFRVTDFKGLNRVMTVKEAFLHSSNIANAKMALDFGGKLQQAFLKKFGVFDSPSIELSEIGSPLVPQHWSNATTITVSYGYGMAVIPCQLFLAHGAIINNGERINATLLYRNGPMPKGERVISSQTSAQIRDLMRLVVTEGTAKLANVEGYNVIGKTGSAHIIHGRGYALKAKRTTFIGAFPHDKPKYGLLVMLEDPKATDKTYGYSTAGWNAAPTAGEIIARVAPVLCVKPVDQEDITQAPEGLVSVSHVDTDFSAVE